MYLPAAVCENVRNRLFVILFYFRHSLNDIIMLMILGRTMHRTSRILEFGRYNLNKYGPVKERRTI